MYQLTDKGLAADIKRDGHEVLQRWGGLSAHGSLPTALLPRLNELVLGYAEVNPDGTVQNGIVGSLQTLGTLSSWPNQSER